MAGSEGSGDIVETKSRMQPLATLPVFFKLAGKRAVLVGGTPPAVWKAELLSATGARVDVYAAEPCSDLLDLAVAPPAGPIWLIRRSWQAGDLEGAAIAIGAIEETREAELFREAAHRHGVPVNVIDNPPFCDFQFGTIVSRSPLIIGISTDGAAPVFGQELRTRIEALLPQNLQRWAEAARDWRPTVQALGLGFRGRRRFWETFTRLALEAGDRPPGNDDLDQCRSNVATSSRATDRVYLVGAGPGEADAITLQAVRALQSADVVIHPDDLSPAIVGYSRREAEKIAFPVSTPFDEIAARIGVLVRQCRSVAWLDRGDPDRCEIWSRRLSAMTKVIPPPERIAGLGLCKQCSPSCPAWRSS